MNDNRYLRSIKDLEKVGNETAIMGYSKDEVCRGMFDEGPSSDNLCRCFYA